MTIEELIDVLKGYEEDVEIQFFNDDYSSKPQGISYFDYFSHEHTLEIQLRDLS